MRVRLASRSKRLLAQGLDAVFTIVPTFVGVMLFAGTDSTFVLIAGVMVSIAYYFLADALPGGQSYGKRVLGIAVIEQRTHRPCVASQSFFRNLFLALLGPIDWLFIFGAKRQRLGDKFASTIVVEADRQSRRIARRA